MWQAIGVMEVVTGPPVPSLVIASLAKQSLSHGAEADEVPRCSCQLTARLLRHSTPRNDGPLFRVFHDREEWAVRLMRVSQRYFLFFVKAITYPMAEKHYFLAVTRCRSEFVGDEVDVKYTQPADLKW